MIMGVSCGFLFLIKFWKTNKNLKYLKTGMFAFDQTNFRDLIPFHRNLQKYTGSSQSKKQRLEMFCKKGVLKNCSDFTGKQLFWRTPPVAISAMAE